MGLPKVVDRADDGMEEELAMILETAGRLALDLATRLDQTARRIAMGPGSWVSEPLMDHAKLVAAIYDRRPDARPAALASLNRTRRKVGAVGPYLLPEAWIMALERWMGRPPWYSS